MDPIEVREERVVPPATVATPVTSAVPVGTPAVTAAPPVAPVVGEPVVPAPLPVAPVSVARYGIYPVAWRAVQTVWFLIGIINVILALDFILRLLGANNVGFAHLIYVLDRVFAAPFIGVFTPSYSDGSASFAWADLLGILVYCLIGWGITKAVRIAATPRGTPAPF